MTIYTKSQTAVIGLTELVEAFKELGEDALPYLKDASNSAGEVVLTKIKSKINNQSNDLSNALKVYKAGRSKKYPYRVFSKITTPAGKIKYVRALELGHPLTKDGKIYGRVKAHPFMRPGADESKEEVISLIAGGLNKAIDKMGGVKL